LFIDDIDVVVMIFFWRGVVFGLMDRLDWPLAGFFSVGIVPLS
jgi:hypothetical protein